VEVLVRRNCSETATGKTMRRLSHAEDQSKAQTAIYRNQKEIQEEI
jgi:hypothetical protein